MQVLLSFNTPNTLFKLLLNYNYLIFIIATTVRPNATLPKLKMEVTKPKLSVVTTKEQKMPAGHGGSSCNSIGGCNVQVGK